MSTRFTKDPDAVLDYKQDWSAWLDDDTIQASEWIIPEGVTKVRDYFDDTSATAWLSGGTAGTVVEVTNRITTVGGRTDDRTMTIDITNK